MACRWNKKRISLNHSKPYDSPSRGKIYEVPVAYIRQKIEIRHPVDAPDELCLYDNGARIAKLKLVDAGENARVFRPDTKRSQVKFSGREIF